MHYTNFEAETTTLYQMIRYCSKQMKTHKHDRIINSGELKTFAWWRTCTVFSFLFELGSHGAYLESLSQSPVSWLVSLQPTWRCDIVAKGIPCNHTRTSTSGAARISFHGYPGVRDWRIPIGSTIQEFSSFLSSHEKRETSSPLRRLCASPETPKFRRVNASTSFRKMP